MKLFIYLQQKRKAKIINNSNMKTLKYLRLLYFTSFVLLCITACSNDNEVKLDGNDDSRGNTSLTVNGTTFSGSYGYWNTAKLNSDTWYQLWIFNTDINSQRDPLHSICITYNKTNGDVTSLATGEFNNYEVSLSIISKDTSKEQDYVAYSGMNDNTDKIKVTKSGSTYKLEVPALRYTTLTGEGSYSGSSFTFSGTLKEMPKTNQ